MRVRVKCLLFAADLGFNLLNPRRKQCGVRVNCLLFAAEHSFSFSILGGHIAA